MKQILAKCLVVALLGVGVGVGCSSAGGVDASTSPGGAGGGGDGAGAGQGGSDGSGLGGGGSGGSVVNTAGGGPGQGCGYAQIPTVREAGAILIVFDQSSSMSEDEDGNKFGDNGFDPATKKWKVTTKAVKDMVTTLPSDTNLGMLLFPSELSDDYCVVPATPQIQVAPLTQSGAAVQSRLSTQDPSGPGGVTPLAQALQAGHTYLMGLGGISGQKAVLLVTDGAPSPLCGQADNETAAIAAEAYTKLGYQTFVIGLAGSAPTLLSQTARNGATDRFPGCNPACGTDLFKNDLETCCHYVAEGGQTAADLGKALSEIASKFLSSCVFSVPKGQDPSKFDPGLVNVIVTQEGGEPQVLKQDSGDGWGYVGGGSDQLEIKGPTCEAILKNPSKVEILLGCPTGQIK